MLKTMCATPNAEPEAINTLHYQIEGKVWEIKLLKKSGSSSHHNHKKKETSATDSLAVKHSTNSKTKTENKNKNKKE